MVIVDTIIEGVLMPPWANYANWWREKSYGLTSQRFRAGWASTASTMVDRRRDPLIVFLLCG